ncbi:hypothetical protein [Nonomuraea terrae]|uniref:hypothetical protein n=1 Tax=Nonomuraea terrae TaxID=2530383 RepID=UPI001FEA7425|nr:hypothetical protein [Nonomuraea terrae]
MDGWRTSPRPRRPAFLFDLDGTLIDGVSRADRRAAPRGVLGIGLLSGGYGRDRTGTGGFRVHADPADMLDRLDELGVRQGD